jgi:ELWxxDGT repeat protein
MLGATAARVVRVAALVAHPVRAGTAPIVVRDGIAPTSLTPISRRLFFAASDAATGIELWTSDGTPAGTRLLKDINPGAASSSPGRDVAMRRPSFHSPTQPGSQSGCVDSAGPRGIAGAPC